tara:strand:+ start:384 stop:839 length:456 start_codon:yes stop_codon:yes gene_type:complete
MSLEQLFSLCSTLALVGWLGLAFAPRWHITRDWIAPVVAPMMIGAVYIWLMVNNFSSAPDGSGFGSLAGVKSLFSIPEIVLAGWIHYLAFDLFVGAWELKDAQKNGIHHLVMIPCLFATFMFGPGGLVLYWIIKFTYRALAFSQPIKEASS